MHAKVMEQDFRPPDELQLELTRLATKSALIDGENLTPIPGVSLMRATSTSQSFPSLYEPCLCVVLQGRKQATLRRETYIYDALNYLVVSVTLPVHGQILEASPQRPYMSLRISIDTTVIADLLARLPELKMQDDDVDRGLFVARTSDEMLDAVLRLMRLLETPRDASVLADSVLREIYYRTLTGELGNRLQALCSAGGHLHRIARAIALIKGRFAEPLRIESVADALHMSVSSLHHHFKAVTAMSPLQFQKQLRLHEARRLMLSERLDAATAAHRVGYESASQFSREYRRLFGAPPRRHATA
jgi:AraC-like DNA-binding protein